MINARAKANRALYLARIVISAWRDALERQDIPASTLNEAFQGGALEHLVSAYGWFLLAISQAAPLPTTPPRSCDDLSPMPEGRVFPPEINECRQLEAGGWIGQMLKAQHDRASGDNSAVRQQGNLAMAAAELPEAALVTRWLEQLEAMIERMGDLLDEC